MWAIILLSGVIASLLVFLAIIVGFSRSLLRVRRTFVSACLSMAVWTIANTMADAVKSEASLFWTQVTFAAAALGAMSFVLFFIVFPIEKPRLRLLYIATIVSGITISLLSFTNLFVPSVDIMGGYANVVPGQWYMVFVWYIVILLIIGLGVLLYKYRRLDGSHRHTIKNMLYGTLVTTLVLMVTNLLLPLITGSNPFAIYGPLAMLIWIFTVSLSIVRYRLFNIRVATMRAASYLFSGLSLGVMAGLVIFVFDLLLFRGHGIDNFQRIFYAGCAVVVGSFFPLVREKFDFIADKIFLREQYEPRRLLTEVANSITLAQDNQELFKHIASRFISRFNIATVGVYLKSGHVYRAVLLKGDAPSQNFYGLEESVFNSQETVVDLIKTEHPEREFYDLVLVLRTARGIIGCIGIGPKKSGFRFSANDRKILETIAGEVAIGVENNMRLDDIKAFNETLKDKIEQATVKLRMNNKKLREVDETKDEFISMASHQLRTPLTSIKGYVSMMLEGDMGKISSEQRHALEQAYDSSQRMVYLIGDFLNLSRLQTGKFELTKVRVLLPEIIEDEIAQFGILAKSRGLKIVYDRPGSDFPMIVADEDKIRQVMMNFIDNAIYYSRHDGIIKIALERIDDNIRFTVKDDGIGVPNNERDKLFTKFYRAHNAKKVRPDGTGIGLFMAKKVIDAHGGEIIFQSTEGQGSVFGFSLPFAK